MDIQKEKKAIKNLKAFLGDDWNLTEEERDDLDNLVSRIVAVVKTEAQAVPEGFVLVNKKDLVKVLNCVTDDWLVDTDSFEEFKKIESLVQDEVNAMIEAQEQSHECQNP